MTKKELVDLIADKRDLSAQMVLTVVEDFMKIIQSSVADGQRIFLRGFGVFQPKERKAKVGRNITRGEQLSIPPKRVPQFRPLPPAVPAACRNPQRAPPHTAPPTTNTDFVSFP